MVEEKNIKYLNKTFSDFKSSLQELAKVYFPNTYNDFSEASPGNMFIEMASYIGDISSFYIDTQIQENFLNLAKERESLYNLAYSFGYRPKLSYASSTEVQITQLIPIIGGEIDFTYSLVIPENTSLTDSFGNSFLTTKELDFSNTSSAILSYYSENYTLITKSVPVISAKINTITATFSSAEKFTSFVIEDQNILQVLEVTGSGGSSDKWYEVPYLAQDSIFESVSNSNSGSDDINYLLSLKQVPQRFVTRVRGTGSIELQFGSGISSIYNDTQILPTPDNINLGLVSSVGSLVDDYNKVTPYFTKTYGVAPSSNLHIKYLVGGGISSNVPAGSLTTIDTTNVNNWFKFGGLLTNLKSIIATSISVNNPNPAVGGRGADTVEEIRLNTLNAYTAQNRAVTKEDYILRTLSLPSRYGNIAKAYITQEVFNDYGNLLKNNPLSLDLYILAYNSDKQLIEANSTLKTNLKTYLNQYRVVTDAINIKNAFYINLGLNFEVNVDPSYNNKEVLSNCISSLKTYFNIDRWQINQPIIISEINATLIQIPGVRGVNKVEFVNKQGGDYSPYAYDVLGATKNGILYPSVDPSIFEIRFPDADINGRVITN